MISVYLQVMRRMWQISFLLLWRCDADTLKKAADAINLIESGELYVSDEEMEMMNTSKISSINI